MFGSFWVVFLFSSDSNSTIFYPINYLTDTFDYIVKHYREKMEEKGQTLEIYAAIENETFEV